MSRRLNSYKRNIKYKQRIARIADNPKRYPCGAYRVGYDGRYTEDFNNTKYIKRTYRANHAPGWSGHLKKLCSKKCRRYKGELPKKGCAYKKIFDYWWELT